MKYLFASLFVLILFCANAQNTALTELKLKFNNKDIEKDIEFIFSITVHNKNSNSIFLPARPVISSVVGEFGDIQIRIERLDSSCFKLLSIDEDPWGVEFSNYTKELKSNDSMFHKIDIRNYGFMKKGFYRVKIYYSYVFKGEKGSVESDWQYIEVKKYTPLKTPNLFREEGQ